MNDETMVAPPATVEILSRGMDCLIKNMGVVDAENFISAVKRERFDYTKWQRTHFDNIGLENFVHDAAVYAEKKRGK